MLLPLSSRLVLLMVILARTIFAKANFAPTSSGVSIRFCLPFTLHSNTLFIHLDPVTALVPTQDGQTLLITTLDSHIRLMDSTTGQMLNDFTGHVNSSYRCRASFGHAEASVVCGDEKGMIWAWDLLDVR
jgi:WD40 repeat protein